MQTVEGNTTYIKYKTHNMQDFHNGINMMQSTFNIHINRKFSWWKPTKRNLTKNGEQYQQTKDTTTHRRHFGWSKMKEILCVLSLFLFCPVLMLPEMAFHANAYYVCQKNGNLHAISAVVLRHAAYIVVNTNSLCRYLFTMESMVQL